MYSDKSTKIKKLQAFDIAILSNFDSSLIFLFEAKAGNSSTLNPIFIQLGGSYEALEMINLVI